MNSAGKFTYVKNDLLPVIKKNYPGNRTVKRRFINDFGRHSLPLHYLLKWKFSPNPQWEEKERDPFRLTVRDGGRFLDDTEDMIVWLGQATFFIRIAGKTILTDPCLCDLPFRKRLAGLPCRVEDIRGIDYLLISHNHRDHLDAKTMRLLGLRGAGALVPLGLGNTVISMNRDLSVQEGGWYQQFNTGDQVSIWLLPARHWSKRSFGDTNRTLWGSYMIRGGGRTVYFAGDTSYAGHFRETAGLFPDIDICLMPIGAYRPDYVMKQSHMTPGEAAHAFNDLGGKLIIPMHYGTYDLSDEPPGEPMRLLKELHEMGGIRGEMRALDIGEVHYLQ